MIDITKRVLSVEDIAYMLEPSVLHLDTSIKDVDKMIEVVNKYHCSVCFCWPCYYEYVTRRLKETGDICKLGTSLAFPSGQESTSLKVYQAKEWAKLNPVVNDMVMNVGMLKAGQYDECLADIKAVREAAPDADLKVIIEGDTLQDVAFFVARKLSTLQGVRSTKTHFFLKTYKENDVLYVEEKTDSREGVTA